MNIKTNTSCPLHLNCSLGGKVIYHTLSFDDKLKAKLAAGLVKQKWYSQRGTFLRLDISLILPSVMPLYRNDPSIEKEYFLYTDTDVLFLKDITTCSFPNPPPFLSMSAEDKVGLPENAGILYVNSTAMTQHHPKIIDFAESIAWALPAYDQDLLMWYLGDIPYLSEVFNWKGYWGSSEEAVIVHFHGPKPCRCLPCLVENPEDFENRCQHDCNHAYMALFKTYTKDKGELYKKVLKMFDDLLMEDEERMLGDPGSPPRPQSNSSNCRLAPRTKSEGRQRKIQLGHS